MRLWKVLNFLLNMKLLCGQLKWLPKRVIQWDIKQNIIEIIIFINKTASWISFVESDLFLTNQYLGSTNLTNRPYLSWKALSYFESWLRYTRAKSETKNLVWKLFWFLNERYLKEICYYVKPSPVMCLME